MDIACPKCDHRFGVSTAAIFKDTSVSMTIELEEGHMLQAGCLGGIITNAGKLLQAGAREIGAKIEPLVAEIACQGNTIKIRFLVAAKPEAKKP